MASSRHAMGLASEEDLKKVKVNCLNSRAQAKRQELRDATEDTNQEGPFQDIGDHGFQIVYENGTLCNFPITITKFWGEVPKPTTLSSKITNTSTSVTRKKKSSKSLKNKIKASFSDKITNKKSTKEDDKDSPSIDPIEQINEEPTKEPSASGATKEANKEDTNDSETESEVELGPVLFDNCSHPPEITGADNRKTLLLPEEHYMVLEPQ